MRKRTPRYAEPLHDDQTPRRRTVSIKGQSREIRVEPMIWSCLAEIAADTDTTVDDLCSRIDALRGSQSLASATRLFVLHFYRLAARGDDEGDFDDGDVFDDGVPPSFDLPPFAPLDAEGGFHARTDGFAEPRPRTASRLERRQAVDRALEILFRE